MNEKAQKAWAEFVDPRITRRRLMIAALYIAAFESLKESIVSHIRDFFATEWDEDGPVESATYRDKVLALDPKGNRLKASVGWLVANEALSDADATLFGDARDLRNTLAHELIATIGDWPEGDGMEVSFDALVYLLNKVERWWIINVEMATDPSFDDIPPEELDLDGILPGRVMAIRVLRDIALSPDDEAMTYLQALKDAGLA
jgi:hypothetical protein